MKKAVWLSAMLSAISYSAETWWTKNLTALELCYRRTVKQLLGVRLQTNNDIVLAETGLPSARSWVLKRQRSFMNKLRHSHWYEHTPLKRALDIAIRANAPMAKYYSAHIAVDGMDPVHQEVAEQRTRIITSDATRLSQYKTINPTLSVHTMYHSTSYIPEHQRIVVTRYRLSSHNLMVERGRWSRIPRNQRVCPCDRTSIQDEQHVLCTCPKTDHLRQRHNMMYTTVEELMKHDTVTLAKFIYDVNQVMILVN